CNHFREHSVLAFGAWDWRWKGIGYILNFLGDIQSIFAAASGRVVLHLPLVRRPLGIQGNWLPVGPVWVVVGLFFCHRSVCVCVCVCVSSIQHVIGSDGGVFYASLSTRMPCWSGCFRDKPIFRIFQVFLATLWGIKHWAAAACGFLCDLARFSRACFK